MKLHRTVTLAAALSVALHTLPAHADAKSDIARGAYLVNGWGCADCHMPLKMGPKGPEPDVSRGMSGHPAGLALPPPPAPQGPWIWGGAATNTAFYGPGASAMRPT